MARRGGAIDVEMKDDALVLLSKGRRLTVANAASEDGEEDADFLVRLDAIQSWDPPDDGTEIDLEELRKILEAIENFAEKGGFDIAFD
jgi:hypothetical protein